MIEQQIKTEPTAVSDDSAAPVSEQIKAFILDRFPAFQGAPFTDETPLLDDGAIDSLGMIELIAFLEETFDVEMDDDDFMPENLETLNALSQMVLAKVAA